MRQIPTVNRVVGACYKRSFKMVSKKYQSEGKGGYSIDMVDDGEVKGIITTYNIIKALLAEDDERIKDGNMSTVSPKEMAV